MRDHASNSETASCLNHSKSSNGKDPCTHTIAPAPVAGVTGRALMGIYHPGCCHDRLRPGGASAGYSLPLRAAALSGREDLQPMPEAL